MYMYSYSTEYRYGTAVYEYSIIIPIFTVNNCDGRRPPRRVARDSLERVEQVASEDPNAEVRAAATAAAALLRR